MTLNYSHWLAFVFGCGVSSWIYWILFVGMGL